MKRILLLSCLLVFAKLSFCQADIEKTQNYIQKYKDIAIEEMKRTGIPASITLAQGLHESGIGESYLAKKTNNHFGIKCHETWTGKTFKYTDDAPNECFRVYDKVEDSYHDHSDFLKNRPRYAVLFTYAPNDYKSWAYGLKKCGYATNPQYAQILIKTIEDNQLHQYDAIALDPNIKYAEYNAADKPVDVSNLEIPKYKNDEEEKPIDVKLKKPDFYKHSHKKIVTVNKLKAVKVNKGETLDALAIAVQKDKADLLAWNDMDNEAELKEGQYLFLQQKKKKNKEKTYKVKADDNMWLIAQKKGIRLSSLLKMNKLEKGEEPEKNQVIRLKGKIKEKPELRKTGTEKSTIQPQVSDVVKANDTVYPPIKEPLKEVIAKDKVLEFETGEKLLEKNPVAPLTKTDTAIQQVEVFDLSPKLVTPDISTPSNTNNYKDIPTIEKPVTEKTVYPASIDYSGLPKSTTGKHTVVKGDTLYNIAKRYGVTIQQLMDWNKMTEQSVKLGQVLKVQP